jgi:hypothetical protein
VTEVTISLRRDARFPSHLSARLLVAYLFGRRAGCSIAWGMSFRCVGGGT